MKKKSPVQGKSRAQKQADRYAQMTKMASQRTLSKPKKPKAPTLKASVGGGSVRARKQAAKYSQMTKLSSRKIR